MSHLITSCSLAGLVLTAAGLPLPAQVPQSPTCVVSSGAPSIARVEGLSELVEDVLLTCSGGTPANSGAALPTVNFTVSLNTNVASRVLAGHLTEALLLIDEPGSPGNTSSQLVCGTGGTEESTPGSGICAGITGTGNGVGVFSGAGARANVFQGQQAGSNSLTWLSVPFDAPGPSRSRVFRFTNLKANANAFGSGTFASTGGVSAIQAALSVSGSIGVNIGNSTVTVAFPQSGLAFSARTADDSAALSAPVSLPACTRGPTRVATLRFSETFATGFRPRTVAPFVDANTSSPPINQNVPGQTYVSESGFRNGAFGSDSLHGNLGGAGLADYGTRLQAVFSNIPAGVSIWVEPLNVSSPATLTARLVTNGSAPFSPTSPSGPTTPLVLLQVTSGSAAAVWEILRANPTQVDTFDFAIYVSLTGAPTGGIAVHSNLAPVGLASPSGPFPQFHDTASSTNLFSLEPSAACDVLTAFPISLVFSIPAGTTASSAQSFLVQSAASINTTISAYTSSGGNWLATASNSIVVPGYIAVSVNPAGLSPGLYVGTVLISAVGASNSLAVIVNLNIEAASSGPGLIVPTRIRFTFQQGQAPPAQKISVTSRDGSAVTFLATAAAATPKGIQWLSVVQTSTQTPATVILTMNPAGLGLGTFAAVVTVTPLPELVGQLSLHSAAPLDTTVTGPQGIIVDALSMAPGPFRITPNTLSFTDTDVGPKNVTVGNTGDVAYTAVPLSVPAGWLTVFPPTGDTVHAPTVAATAMPTNLSPNPNYAGQVAIQDLAGSPNGGAVDVTLAVSGASPQLLLDNDSIQACSVAGGTALAPFFVTVSGTGSSLNYTTRVTSGSAWLSATSGATTSKSTIRIDPTVNGGLAPGEYNDSVLFVASGAANQPGLAVHLTVASSSVGCPVTSSTSSLPHIAVGGGFVTDLYIVNSSITAAHYSIGFHDDTGAPIASLPNLAGSVSAYGVRFYELGTPQSAGQSGSATITGDPGITVQALFRRLGADNSYYEAAVPQSPGGNEFWIPFDASTFTGNGSQIFTGMAIANLDPNQAANVSCTAQDTMGRTIPNAVTVPRLNPLGHWANYVFPTLTGRVGTLHCTSNTSVGSMGIRALGPNAISSLPVIGQGGAPSGISLLPQLAVGGEFVTDLYVVNSGNSSANFSVNFYDDTGAQAAGLATISDSFTGNGVKFYELGPATSPLQTGSASISGSAGITVQALFRRLGADNSYYEAAVPMNAGSNEFLIPFDATTFTGDGAQIFTGIAIANFDPNQAANVSCTAQDTLGNTIPNAVFVPQVGPRGHWANYLFPALTGLMGTLHCTSDTSVGAVGIRALGSNAISTLPVITLAGQ
jgi:hypothetical protein